MPNKVKVVSVCGKTSDMCSISFLDDKGKVVGRSDGYVPKFMPGEHYGDYIELEIEVATGKILNWVVPTQDELEASFDNDEEE